MLQAPAFSELKNQEHDDRNRRAFGMRGLQLIDRVGIIGLRSARAHDRC